MSRWQEQFSKHPIHKTLDDAEKLIGAKKDDAAEADLVERRRIKKIIATYREALSQANPEMVPFNNLDALNNQIRHANIWNQLTTYSQNGNASNLQAANDHFTNTLAHLPQISPRLSEQHSETLLRSLEQSVDEFAAAVDSKKKSLQSEIAGHKGDLTKQQQELKALAYQITQKKQGTDELITDWQKQFSEAQSKRGEDFNSEQKARTSEFNQWCKDTDAAITDKFEQLFEETSNKVEKAQTDFQGRIDGHISDAEQKHERILELYQLTADDSVGAGYIKNANEEGRQADFWRWATICFVVLTAIWTGVSYFIGPLSGDDSGTVLLGKVIKAFSVTGVLLFGAVYSAKQSNAHRTNERKNRRFALEVKAIDPFISSLDEADQKILKKELSERLFGQKDGETDHDSKVIEEHAFSTVIKGLIDVLKASK